MERLNYHHLFLFWIFTQEGTFTKTANRLSIAQSAVTAQIKNLEDLLGLALIDRKNRRKPILTEDGKSVLEFANSIFETGDELLKWAKLGVQGKAQVLKIGALSGLSRNLQFEFLKPIIGLENIRIEVVTGDQDKLVRLLKEHHLEIILSSHNVPADGRITLHSNVLTSSPFLFVIAKGQKIRGADLEGYLERKPLFLPSRNFEARPEIDAVLDRFKRSKAIRGEIDDIALLRILAIKSGALVVIPEMGIRSEIASGEVHVVAKPKGLEQKFYVISRQKRSRNPIAEMLIAKMQD